MIHIVNFRFSIIQSGVWVEVNRTCYQRYLGEKGNSFKTQIQAIGEVQSKSKSLGQKIVQGWEILLGKYISS